MIDKCGRKIDYLRISVTDRCNFRCVSCMPEQGVPPIAHTQIISFEEILRICRVMAGLGIRKLKVTGGEPLVRRGVCDFIRAAKELPGIEQVTLTTNGALLPQYLPELIASRIDGVNISLDTLDPDTYRRITRRGCLADVLAAINAAWEAGIPRLKINSVLLKGVNDHPEIIRRLNTELLKAKVRPYYLFQCDLVRGVEHFRTPLSRGIEIMEHLRGRLSGLAIPTFVVDAPHGGGKIPLLPNYVVTTSPTHTVLRNFEGMMVSYPEPDPIGDSRGDRWRREGSPEVCDLVSGRATAIVPQGTARGRRRSAIEHGELAESGKQR